MPRRRSRRECDEFWALRDLDVAIPQGAAVGVIGRNGAGKSTLLKLLSQITVPTTGRIELAGRVASLLEVGTGFHAELTGRENIYLNGTILGMTRQEIRRRFDEIVEFSGISRFLDTPVKHYSSGMYVRLAFSVAAHLECEILLIDEVLAVGDAEFQAKCLGKMGSITHEGRTVLLVSHNLGALRRVCTTGLVLDGGRLVAHDTMERCVESYTALTEGSAEIDLAQRTDRAGTGEIVFTRVDLHAHGTPRHVYRAGDDLEVTFHLRKHTEEINRRVLVWFQVMKNEQVIFTGNSQLYGPLELSRLDHRVRCSVPRLPLFAGRYYLRVFIMVDGRRSDYVEHAVIFEVDDAHFFPSGKTPVEKEGVLVDQAWQVDPAP